MTEPIRISWSQLRVHDECKKKSHLIRTGKRPTVQNLRNYFHGMVTDSIMRKWLDSPLHADGHMMRMVDDMIEQGITDAAESGDGIVKWRSIEDREELRQYCIELLRRLEPILREKVLPYTYEGAKRFKVPIVIPDLRGEPATVLLTGEMDLLVEDHGWVIWDLKATKDDQYWRKTLGQLTFYDLAVFAMSGRPSRLAGFIQPMCKEPVLEINITDQDRREMWGRIINMAHDIWKADTACKADTAGCNYCEVKHACPRFDPDADDSPTLSAALYQAAQHMGAPR